MCDQADTLRNRDDWKDCNIYKILFTMHVPSKMGRGEKMGNEK